VVNQGLALPFIGIWPDGVKRVGTISHDSDGNEDEQARSTLGILREVDVKSTWCMLEPGYSAEIYDKIKADGHELAFHFNAMGVTEGPGTNGNSFVNCHG
jgi:hypothetical protein